MGDRLRVLDLFCGRGGWSRPFVEDGDEVTGVDKASQPKYPGLFIKADILNDLFVESRPYDLIIGSPPCGNFSKMKENRRTFDLTLIRKFEKIVEQNNPRIGLMENVTELLEVYERKPIWKFKIGSQATRYLWGWGNVQIPLAPPFVFPERILASRTGRFFAKRKGVRALPGPEFAEIPYPIARFIADTVKVSLKIEPEMHPEPDKPQGETTR